MIADPFASPWVCGLWIVGLGVLPSILGFAISFPLFLATGKAWAVAPAVFIQASALIAAIAIGLLAVAKFTPFQVATLWAIAGPITSLTQIAVMAVGAAAYKFVTERSHN